MKPSFEALAMAGSEFAGPREGFDRGESRSSHLLCARFAGSSASFRGIVCVLLLISLAGVAWSQKRPVDLTGMSIEELMQVQVTSVSKKQESLSQTAAAIYVITPEDIRRSGATSIPELLRMVPGLHAAHIDANKRAIAHAGSPTGLPTSCWS